MNKTKVVQFGCGKMSIYTMRYVLEKNGELVGAIDVNPNVIGKDLGELLNISDLGVKVSSIEDAETLLSETKPDVCIITTMSLMSDLKDAFMLCSKLGINAISTCEESFFPIVSSPSITNEIDKLAKENNCTITGSGYQDVFWGNLISTLAGATQSIKQIKGSSSYNVEDYGIALAEVHGCGLTLAEFEEKIASADNISSEERQMLIEKGEFLPSYMWSTAGWLADKLNLTITSQVQKCVPITYEEDLHSETLGLDIEKGKAIGMSAVVTAQTEEGIEIVAECIGKVYAKGVVDVNDWTIYGEPDTRVVISEPKTVELTCASIVNRIPDVIKAKAGFVPTSQMGEMTFKKEI